MSPTSNAEVFAKTHFDIIIIGAGTAGLPIAARLSENPGTTVGVLEAGLKISHDSLVDVPQYLGRSIGNPKYDWSFSTFPQESALGRTISLPRGRGVGGSTLINYMAWDRACKAEYDAWKTLGDPDDAWDWNSILPYLLASEGAATDAQSPNDFAAMSLSGKDVVNIGLSDTQTIGRDGPVKTSYNSIYTEIIPPYIKALNSIGVPTNNNPFGGQATGVYNVRRNVDIAAGKRSTAAEAYLTPSVSSRSNLQILTGAHVTKVLLKPKKNAAGNLVATGVEFVVEGRTFTVEAAKEVILSAGSVQTPQILELSGIGKKELLNRFNIETQIDLPGVGENLHDHTFIHMQFLLKPGTVTFDQLRNSPKFLAEQQDTYESSKNGWLAAVDSTTAYNPLGNLLDRSIFAAMLDKLKVSIDNGKQQGMITPLQAVQYKIQTEWLRKAEVPTLETLLMSKGIVAPADDASYFFLMTGLQHPFSRGSIHIDSTDPFKSPRIDPKYLSHDFDIDALVVGYRLMEKVVGAEPLKGLIEAQSLPPLVLKNDQSVIDFIRATGGTGSHLMGTCALARHELGGVVGNDLKVYGTSNLRVADASIIPLPIACHIQATVFAIGEKAADLIKRDI